MTFSTAENKVAELEREYLDHASWLVRENANVNEAAITLFWYISKKVISDDVFRLLPEKAAKYHKEGWFHINKLWDGGWWLPYCCGFDTARILQKGLITPSVVSRPPKHLDSAVDQLANFIMMAAQERSVTGDTPVLVKIDGCWRVMTVEEVYRIAGPDKVVHVFAFTPDGKVVEAPARIVYHGKQKVIRIKLADGSWIDVTPDHSVFKYENGRIVLAKAGEVKVGDYLVVPYKLNLTVREYRPEDFMKLARAKSVKILACDGSALALLERPTRVMFVREEYGKSAALPVKVEGLKLDSELAWVLGWYVAEGSLVYDATTHRWKITITLGKRERYIAERIAKVLNERGIPATVRENKSNYVVEITSTLWWLFEECGKRSEDKVVPWFIFDADEEVVRAFLRGLFSGDGHVHRRSSKSKAVTIELKTASWRLAVGVVYLLARLGIRARIVVDEWGRKHKPTWSAIYKVEVALYENIEKFYKLIGFDQPEKNAVVEEYLRGANLKYRGKRGAIPIKGTDLAYVKVVEVREIGEADVYDFEVPPVETFIAGWMPVCLHNTGAVGLNAVDLYLAPFVVLSTGPPH